MNADTPSHDGSIDLNMSVVSRDGETLNAALLVTNHVLKLVMVRPSTT